MEISTRDLILIFVLVGLVGWSVLTRATKGLGPQPIWTSPEYLRYNRPA